MKFVWFALAPRLRMVRSILTSYLLIYSRISSGFIKWFFTINIIFFITLDWIRLELFFLFCYGWQLLELILIFFFFILMILELLIIFVFLFYFSVFSCLLILNLLKSKIIWHFSRFICFGLIKKKKNLFI